MLLVFKGLRVGYIDLFSLKNGVDKLAKVLRRSTNHIQPKYMDAVCCFCYKCFQFSFRLVQ